MSVRSSCSSSTRNSSCRCCRSSSGTPPTTLPPPPPPPPPTLRRNPRGEPAGVTLLLLDEAESKCALKLPLATRLLGRPGEEIPAPSAPPPPHTSVVGTLLFATGGSWGEQGPDRLAECLLISPASCVRRRSM
jgi:hypothetical protein